MTAENTLETMFTDGKEISFGDRKVLVKNVALGDLPVLLKVLAKIFELMKKEKKDQDMKATITKALSEDFDSIIQIFEITTDLKTDEIKKLNLAATAILLNKIISENADFLQRHVIPVIRGMATTINGLNKSNG